MSDTYEIRWLGWNNSPGHDKVWGYLVTRTNKTYAFWGRRGKSLRFKLHSNEYAASALSREKERKGYKFVKPADYDRLVKDFVQEVELYCMTAILSETVM